MTSASGFDVIGSQQKLDQQYNEMLTKLHTDEAARAKRLADALAIQQAAENVATQETSQVAQQQAVQTPVRVAGNDVWAALRICESGGNYADNTGNGFYGAYQFDITTWNGYGGYTLPSAAPPAIQDQKAQMTQAVRGWSPWPSCSRQLGL